MSNPSTSQIWRLLLASLYALSFYASGQEPVVPKAPPKYPSPTAKSIEGRWLSAGYGDFVEIRGGTMRNFEVTSLSCVPSLNVKIESVRLTLDPSGEAARLRSNGAVSEVILRRVGELPKSCQEVTENTPQKNYAVFWQTFAENYPFFDLRHVAWAEVDKKYRPLVSSGTSPKELFGILRDMIKPLGDRHTYLEAEDIKLGFRGSRPDPGKLSNDEYMKYSEIIWSKYVRGELKSFCKGKVWFGLLDGSVGYLLIPVFIDFGGGPDFEAQSHSLEEALDQIFRDSQKLKGLVIDVRYNSGGYDGLGLIIASRLTRRKYLAYSKETRDSSVGPGHFTPQQSIWVNPSQRPGFQGHVVLLIGRDCASACETFAMAMMQRQPTVVRLGENTEGVFSDVLDRRLPNGWHFGLSNEVYRTGDGRTFEGTGVPPDIGVPIFSRTDLQSRRDPAVERALEILSGSTQH